MLPMYDGQKQGDVAEDSKLARMLTMMIRFLTKHVPGRIQYENRTLTRLSFGTRRCLWGESVGMKNSLKGLFADICCVLGQNTPPIRFHRNVRRTTVQKLEQQLSYYDMTKCGCILYKQYVYTYIYIYIFIICTLNTFIFVVLVAAGLWADCPPKICLAKKITVFYLSTWYLQDWTWLMQEIYQEPIP